MNNHKTSFLKKYWFPIVVICIYIPLALFLYKFNDGISIPLDISKWGAFGDYVGGIVGTLFSFFALLGVYLTYEELQKQNQIAKDEKRQNEFDSRVNELYQTAQTTIDSFILEKNNVVLYGKEAAITAIDRAIKPNSEIDCTAYWFDLKRIWLSYQQLTDLFSNPEVKKIEREIKLEQLRLRIPRVILWLFAIVLIRLESTLRNDEKEFVAWCKKYDIYKYFQRHVLGSPHWELTQEFLTKVTPDRL